MKASESGSVPRIGQFRLAARDTGFGCAKQPRVTQTHMPQQVIRKFIVDDHDLRVKVRGHTGQSETILRGLDLEVGIGQDGRYGAQKHGSDEGRHQRDALRHDEHNAIADGNAIVLEQSSLHSRHAAKFAEGGSLLLVFVDPGGHKRPVRRR